MPNNYTSSPHPQHPGFSSSHLKGEKGKWGGSWIWLRLGDGLDHRLQERLFKGQHWYLENNIHIFEGFLFSFPGGKGQAPVSWRVLQKESRPWGVPCLILHGATLDVQTLLDTQFENTLEQVCACVRMMNNMAIASLFFSIYFFSRPLRAVEYMVIGIGDLVLLSSCRGSDNEPTDGSERGSSKNTRRFLATSSNMHRKWLIFVFL